MQILRSLMELSAWAMLQESDRETLAFVPTMGALHEGHLSLVRQGKQLCRRVLVSIFVNPMQFGPGEDFDRYPRGETQDLAFLKAAEVDAVYLPAVKDIYPEGFATKISVEGMNNQLCGATRPGHFDGVATVVAKLLLQVAPDVAIFGEKDYQQLHIIRRMVRDLDIPVNIVGGQVVREADGLAMSSRNRYLSADERAIAPALYRLLTDTAGKLPQGTSAANVQTVMEAALAELGKSGFTPVDYLELRDAKTLQPIRGVSAPARLLAAAYLGKTRLIDNVAVAPGKHA